MTFVTLLVYITYLKTGLFARQHYIKKKQHTQQPTKCAFKMPLCNHFFSIYM